jgi:DNA-directed RNA polymerase subunit M/transcription elongation factor TFIIS
VLYNLLVKAYEAATIAAPPLSSRNERLNHIRAHLIKVIDAPDNVLSPAFSKPVYDRLASILKEVDIELKVSKDYKCPFCGAHSAIVKSKLTTSLDEMVRKEKTCTNCKKVFY